MAEKSGASRLRALAEVLEKHGVRFIVIGGQAEVLLGGARPTADVDLCYQRAADNLDRLATALREIKPRLRGAPPDLPFRIDAQSLALGGNFTFETDLGDLDLLAYVEPLGGYEELSRSATTEEVGGLKLRVISLDDLIAIKQHLGRPKDRQALLQLMGLKRIRDESARRE